MKVRLAAQVISSSVADSQKFCQSENFEDFKDYLTITITIAAVYAGCDDVPVDSALTFAVCHA